MTRMLPGIICGLLLFNLAEPTQAQLPAGLTSSLAQNGWVRFRLEAGQIRGTGQNFGGGVSTKSQGNGWQQSLSVQSNGGQANMQYELNTKETDFKLQMDNGGGKLTAQRVPKDPTAEKLVYVQEGGECKLTISAGEKTRELHGATLWHLFLAEPELCNKQLAPLLELFRSNWRLGDTAGKLEESLLKLADGYKPGDRTKLQDLVDQLKDASYSKRHAAHRQLREEGESVVPFLKSLDRSELDPEQLSRIDSIIASFWAQSGEDKPNELAQNFIGEPAIWFALLSRDDQAKRSKSAAHLEKLLGSKLAFDPAADAATRKEQLDKLRPRFFPKSDTKKPEQEAVSEKTVPRGE